MKNVILLIFVICALVLVTSKNIYSQENEVKVIFPADSNNFYKPHDVLPNNINTTPLLLPLPPKPYESLLFTNVDISNNSAPQNEPSVKISRKDPNRVVAAWRDFRFGVDPNAIRRVAYSYSTDAGVTWAVPVVLDSMLIPNGYTKNSDPSVATDTDGVFYISTIALSSNNQIIAVYKSTDGGVTFPSAVSATTVFSDKEYITCDFAPGSPHNNTLYMCWTGYNPQTIIMCTRSTDHGVTWLPSVSVSASNSTVQAPDIAIGMNGDVYIVWFEFPPNFRQWFSKSTDGGITFSAPMILAEGPDPAIPFALSNTWSCPSIATDISNGPRFGNIYVTWCDARNGDADVFLISSTNRGSNWSAPLRVNNDGIGNGKLQCYPWIAVDDSGRISIVYYDSRNTPSNSIIEAWLATSTDGGQTVVNSLLSTMQSPTNTPGTNVRFGEYIGIDFWKNHIVSVWTDERAGGFDQEIYTAVVNGIPIGVPPLAKSVPAEYKLFQNYPNPFNPTTEINYQLPSTNYVSLAIYDLLGREVEVLVNERQQPGEYQVTWDATNYASGIYFYKLIVTAGAGSSTGDFSETKKMLLLK